MKKKLLIVMFAAMMLATSCNKPDDDDLGRGGTQVTFLVGLESVINNRAISDGSGINQLHYAIFDDKKNLVESSKDGDANFPFSTSTSLVKGQDYTAVFWAQNKDCKAYTVSEDMRSVSVNYSNSLNNDESRDAFFKSVTFTVTDHTNVNIILKRPFAQLNVGISEKEWKKASEQGITIEKSAVEIKQAATTLNLVDGTVSDPEDITFKTNTIPTEQFLADINLDGAIESYKYLSMCYFLPYDEKDGASKTLLTDLSFTLSSADGLHKIVLEKGLENAPVQRNHRTNIISNGILTSDVNVKVSLDVLYDGEHILSNDKVWEEYLGIFTEEALAGKTIEITSDWLIRNGYILEPLPEYWNNDSKPLYNNSFTVDGNGNTITFEPYNYSFVTKNAFAATNGELVTVKDLTFAGEHFGVFGGVYGAKNYKILFDNVQIVNNGIYCYNKNGSIPVSAFSNLGEATLENCTINGSYWVGATKDKNTYAQNSINNFGGVYDVFVPNDGTTIASNSTIGRIFVHNHGKLTITGNSSVHQIVSPQLVNGKITIEANAEVTLMNVNQYSTKYPPVINIKSGAKIETLQLNSINKSKVSIEDGATIGKIIWCGNEYTSIEEFKNAQ